MNKGRPFSELSDTGILWFINRSVFHPLGFALAIYKDSNGEVTGWSILGDGSEVWTFEGTDDDEHFARAMKTLNELRKK